VTSLGRPDERVAAADLSAVQAQLGRPPRGTHAVGHRCPCGLPDTVVTEPRLPDGTPFPTTFYLTCPRAASLIGTLEGSGLMREMETRLADDAELANVSAGGMPDRVKCLHALAGHSLAAGPGVNPLGDEVLERLGAWWSEGPCVDAAASSVEPPSSVERGRGPDA
jgi:hypothetical protein